MHDERRPDEAGGPSAPGFRLAHVSDIHFGKIADPGVVGALVDEINGADVALVCVSGDLTQRARVAEFEAARAMLERFTAPYVVVPGNHDVYAWWSPFKRVFRPLRRYRRYVTDDLTPRFEVDGLAALGINTAYGRTRKGGRISPRKQEAVRSFFSNKPAASFKVLVLHHHLMRLRALGDHDVARNATRTLALARASGVDLVLCGHLHVSHVEHVEAVGNARRVVIASAGTATSTRGRGAHRLTNFYNLVHVSPEAFEVEERRFLPAERRFETERRTSFAR